MPNKASKKNSGSQDFVTFDDIFTLALAECETKRFTSDAGKWHEALYEVCIKYRNKLPALREVFFREKPLPLQTNQFYELITILSSSSLITLPNPSYSFIQMDKRQKSHARVLESELLSKNSKEIKEIARILDGRLALSR